MKQIMTTALLSLLSLLSGCEYSTEKNSVRIGVLHNSEGEFSQDNTMMISAIKLAISEVNQEGGVNGLPVEIVYRDAANSDGLYAQKMQELLGVEKVRAVFGCPDIECLTQSKEQIEGSSSMLFYAGESIGGHVSDRIFTLSALPTQIYPLALNWAQEKFGKRALFIANKERYSMFNYVFAQKQLEILGGELKLLLLDPEDLNAHASYARVIASYNPDFVINAISGRQNRELFSGIKTSGLETPILSTSMTATALEHVKLNDLQHSYVVSSYLMSHMSKVNQAFIDDMQQLTRSTFIPASAAASYTAVKLWANTARNAGTVDSDFLISAIDLESHSSPSGIIIVDNNNQSTWRRMYIGQYKANGHTDIVWQSSKSIQPLLLPAIKDEAMWTKLINGPLNVEAL
ncbi:transporter substrate-binding protein [Vibrio ulleungensis]|uniref:Transporter substrate-binding protein n=1 Tax=Vibrio ulleungensis TaxID=2807619 RepID=A0ABS2HML3_9VIBR|nr:transporter substrate-binding protein [Vibrio ulleungensis]MBM7037807.1 transporter substrate-binding protein [Vibrio ulleungensis]